MLKVNDSFTDHPFLVEKVSIAKTKKGEDYLNLELRDKEKKSYQAKLWRYSLNKFGSICDGDIIDADGEVGEYNGQLQLTLIYFVKSVSSVADDFSKDSSFIVEGMWSELVDIVDGFTEPMTKYIAEEMLIKQAQTQKAFMRAPAAKGVHNAWYGGLIEHTYSMCKMAENVVAFYKNRYNAPISRDKVLFGVLLHDIGKILEYDYSNPAFNMNPIGILTNHLVLGPAWILEYANNFKETYLLTGKTMEDFRLERALLMHLVAAHHGTKEWGSPVVPSTLEAILVHQIDMIDTNMMHALEYIKEKPGSIPGFTAKSWMSQTSYYKG